jgi:hypothetical protein
MSPPFSARLAQLGGESVGGALKYFMLRLRASGAVHQRHAVLHLASGGRGRAVTALANGNGLVPRRNDGRAIAWRKPGTEEWSMQSRRDRRRSLFASAALLAVASPAAATVYPTPTLPPPGAVYVGSGAGAGCFEFAGLCVTPGSLSVGSTISDTFSAGSQLLDLDGVFSTTLTPNAGPTIPFNMTGTFEERVLGRTSDTATGSWTTDLLSADFTGTLPGGTAVTLGLDPLHTSGGTTSIETAVGGGYIINSFFDVWVELSTNSTPPLATTRGPLTLTLVPEPATIALLGLPLAGLLAVRRLRCAAG